MLLVTVKAPPDYLSFQQRHRVKQRMTTTSISTYLTPYYYVTHYMAMRTGFLQSLPSVVLKMLDKMFLAEFEGVVTLL